MPVFYRLSAALVFAGLIAAGCSNQAVDAEELACYDYRQTKKIIHDVKKAANLAAEKGDAAFKVLPRAESDDDFYVYVYSRDGACLFHGGEPGLEGKNLLDVRDARDREVLKMAWDAASDPENPHGWIHYYWNQPGRFFYVKKSSCNFIVETPEGEAVLVGGGLNNPPVERVFLKATVDGAARLIAENGESALEELRSADSRFHYHDSIVFVLNSRGEALVDPVHLSATGRNYKDSTDSAGYHCIGDLLDKLATADSAWVIIQTHDRMSRNLIKRALYGRKTVMGDRPVIAAGLVEIPKPAWSD